MADPIEFMTVGQLRAALEGVPDDRRIIPQVVGQDHSAWNLFASFTPLVQGSTGLATLTLFHPSFLKSLPKVPSVAPSPDFVVGCTATDHTGHVCAHNLLYTEKLE